MLVGPSSMYAMGMADILYENLTDDPDQEALGDVRALIPDIEQLANPIDPTDDYSYIFSDGTLKRYIRMASGNVKRAAAYACDALGTSEGLILKKITTDDLVTDGAALMKEYGAKANRLRDEARAEEGREEDGSGVITSPLYRSPLIFDGEVAARGGYQPWR